MHQGALTNSLAIDEGTGPVTERELLGTIAERQSREPLDGHPAERWLHGLPADLEPAEPTAIERWLERWPRASIAVVCVLLVLATAVPGVGEPELEAELAEHADQLATRAATHPGAPSASEPR